MGETHASQVSRTALRVAVRRAAHQLLDNPPVFMDPLALPIIGPDAERKLRSRLGGAEREWNNSLRAWIAARSRYAEDELARAVRQGVRQYVVLGAGLDTFAYRNPYPGLRVWEVDQPGTQAWKRAQLHAAAIPIPDSLTFLPVDFERQSLGAALRQAAFDPASPAFLSWLGVTPFLTRSAFLHTLATAGELHAELVFDYAVDPSVLDEQDRFAFDLLSRRVHAAGEPYRLFFRPPEIAAALAAHGFQLREDLGKHEINTRYFSSREDNLKVTSSPARLASAHVGR